MSPSAPAPVNWSRHCSFPALLKLTANKSGGLIGLEAVIGVAYAVAAFALFSYLERSARANATLDVR